MRNVLGGLLIGSLVLGMAGVSHAIPFLEIEGGFEGSIPLNPNTHDVAVTRGASGWYGANLIALENVNLTYKYLGYEAGWTNSFQVDGKLAFMNYSLNGDAASLAGSKVSSTAAAGSLLDFAFNILVGGNAGHGVKNGSNVLPYGTPNTPDNGYSSPNFFIGYADASHQSVYIALDDGGGAHWSHDTLADDDHDDLVIKVTATAAPVPEPASMLLFGTGLTCFAGFRLRGKKK